VFFAPNQEKTVSLSADELKSTESRCSELEDTNKALIMEVKAAQAGMLLPLLSPPCMRSFVLLTPILI
jgi:hypothetical protein